MFKQLRKRTEGFTIIEVMIVLAIAGLILLIVFLAVPALQRNSRNTQRRNDVAKLLAAVQEYANNNNGSVPTATGVFNTQFASTQVTTGFYQTANIAWLYQASAAAVPQPATISDVTIANNAFCSNNAAVATGASTRTIVGVFNIESSSGARVQQCVGS